MAGNNAISANPSLSNIDINTAASSFLWAMFSCMAAAGFGLIFWGSRKPVGQRAFHHIAGAICFTASVAYFSMAANLGSTPIAIEYIRAGDLGQNYVAAGIAAPTRAVFYARYIDWTITTPLLLLELLLTTGLPLSEIFQTIFMDEVMIIAGLIGALVSSQYKWGYFTFGMLAQGYVWYVLLVTGRASAARLGPEFSKAYLTSAIILSFLWAFYPIAWILSEGGNVIGADGEMVFYGVLDLLAKPVFCVIHCLAIADCDYNRLGFSSGKYSESSTREEHSFFNSTGDFIDEKHGAVTSSTGSNSTHAEAIPVAKAAPVV